MQRIADGTLDPGSGERRFLEIEQVRELENEAALEQLAVVGVAQLVIDEEEVT